MRKLIRYIGNTIIFSVGILFIASLLIGTNMIPFKSMIVLSGSMSPALKPGDLIIDKNIEAKDIKLGDIITYKLNNNIIITHRVTDIVNRNEEIFFKTKGDANNVEDEALISEDKVIGKYALKIPYAGFALNFIKGKMGFALFIIIPAVLLIIDNFKTINKEFKKLKEKDSKNDLAK